jgi:hypothetical protein
MGLHGVLLWTIDWRLMHFILSPSMPAASTEWPLLTQSGPDQFERVLLTDYGRLECDSGHTSPAQSANFVPVFVFGSLRTEASASFLVPDLKLSGLPEKYG